MFLFNKQIKFSSIFFNGLIFSLLISNLAQAQIAETISVDDCVDLLISESFPSSLNTETADRPFFSSMPVTFGGQQWIALIQDTNRVALIKPERKGIQGLGRTSWRISKISDVADLRRSRTPWSTQVKGGGNFLLMRNDENTYLYRAFGGPGKTRLEKVFVGGGKNGSHEILDLSEDGDFFLTVRRDGRIPTQVQLRRTAVPMQAVHSFDLKNLDLGLGVEEYRVFGRFFFDNDRMIAISQGAQVRVMQDSAFESSLDWTVRGDLTILTDGLAPLATRSFDRRSMSSGFSAWIDVSMDRQAIVMPLVSRLFTLTGSLGSILSESEYALPEIKFDRLLLADLKTNSETDQFKETLCTRAASVYWPKSAPKRGLDWVKDAWVSIKNSVLKAESPEPSFTDIYAEYLRRAAPGTSILAYSPDKTKAAIYIQLLRAIVIWDISTQKVVGTYFRERSQSIPLEIVGLSSYFSPDGHSLWMDHSILENEDGLDFHSALKTGLTLWNFESAYSK